MQNANQTNLSKKANNTLKTRAKTMNLTSLIRPYNDKNVNKNIQTLMAFLPMKGRVKKTEMLALKIIIPTGEHNGIKHHQRNHQFNFILDRCRRHHSLLLWLVCKKKWRRLGRMVCPWSHLPILHCYSSNYFLL